MQTKYWRIGFYMIDLNQALEATKYVNHVFRRMKTRRFRYRQFRCTVADGDIQSDQMDLPPMFLH